MNEIMAPNPEPLEHKAGALPVELRFLEECTVAQVFSTPLPSTHFAEQTESHMNSW